MENEKKSFLLYIHSLEQRIEFLDRLNKSSCVELRNIPPTKNETFDKLYSTVSKLCQTLDVPLEPAEIRNIYRGYAKDAAKKLIIIELTSESLKNKILFSYKAFNENKNSKLSTSEIQVDQVDGPNIILYLPEYLTPKMKRLHFLAKDFASTNGFKFYWPTPRAIIYEKEKVNNQFD